MAVKMTMSVALPWIVGLQNNQHLQRVFVCPFPVPYLNIHVQHGQAVSKNNNKATGKFLRKSTSEQPHDEGPLVETSNRIVSLR
jgi:hypothetical protein